MSDTSLVLTSCGRVDLLERTVASFRACNTAALAKSILVADSADPAVHARVERAFGGFFDEIICNESKLGQIASID